MTLDIRGSLKNTKLSSNKYVVFEELISNSIDSFLIRRDESSSPIDLRIAVEIELFATDLLNGALDVAISCTDNGCGLGDEQTNAFLTKDTSYKDDLSIVGIGPCIYDAPLHRLPQMRVDVFLKSSERWIIIDTKYYADALQRYWDAETYHSGNMYQLFSYLKNAAVAFAPTPPLNGMLLYPQVSQELDDRLLLQGHHVHIATVNLAQPWRRIERRLLALVGVT
jgi:hypothetical protein